MEENIIDKFYRDFPDGATIEVPVIKSITKRRIKIPARYVNKKVLIIGDAFAHESKFLHSKGFTNITSTVKHEREVKIGEPTICDIHSLPFKDAEFDFVYCSHVLEHAVAPMIALAEICRVLKKRGEGLLWMPYSDDSQDMIYHLSSFRPAVWKNLIIKTGFTLKYQEDYKPRKEWGYWIQKK